MVDHSKARKKMVFFCQWRLLLPEKYQLFLYKREWTTDTKADENFCRRQGHIWRCKKIAWTLRVQFERRRDTFFFCIKQSLNYSWYQNRVKVMYSSLCNKKWTLASLSKGMNILQLFIISFKKIQLAKIVVLMMNVSCSGATKK